MAIKCPSSRRAGPRRQSASQQTPDGQCNVGGQCSPCSRSVQNILIGRYFCMAGLRVAGLPCLRRMAPAPAPCTARSAQVRTTVPPLPENLHSELHQVRAQPLPHPQSCKAARELTLQTSLLPTFFRNPGDSRRLLLHRGASRAVYQSGAETVAVGRARTEHRQLSGSPAPRAALLPALLAGAQAPGSSQCPARPSEPPCLPCFPHSSMGWLIQRPTFQSAVLPFCRSARDEVRDFR